MISKKIQNILSLNLQEFRDVLKSEKISICVVGIGRIGLPTALSFANSGFPTIGVDINEDLVKMLNSGIFPLKDEPGLDKIFEQVKNKKFSATTSISEAVSGSNVIILSLPTPMDRNNVPNYSSLISVGKSLNQFLESGSLIIVESTVEPGFVENKLIPIIEGDESKMKLHFDFSIAACPETANPGEILKDFSKIPRLVGGISEHTSSLVSELYRHVFNVEIIHMPDCKSANAAKLTANIFRDINIGLVNELALLFEDLGIDIIKVLEACDKKYNFQIHYPGAGVGGPCLPVNSYQMLNSALGTNTGILRIIKAARETNEYMPYHVVDLLIDALNEMQKPVRDSNITILGVSYKPNVKDIQLSPAEEIIRRLERLGARLKIYDPFFKSSQAFSHKVEADLSTAITNSDAVIIVTAHDEFTNMSPSFLASKLKIPIVIDSRGVLEPKAAKKAGLVFRGIGRGGI